MKDRYCQIIMGKAKYYIHIPHRVVCIFGQYMGHTVDESRLALRECFEEFDSIPDKSKADHLSVYYFGKETIVSQQLYQCAYSNDVNLNQCPEAFVDIQERSFASNVARYIEAEHKKTKATETNKSTCEYNVNKQNIIGGWGERGRANTPPL